MSEETIHKQKFVTEQWRTTGITLYPTRASVTREINSVQLKAGLNELTISDLTSHADPDSIRVAGKTENQPARINDLTIDLVPNKSYLLDTSSDDEDDDDDDDDDELAKPESLISAEAKYEALQEQRRASYEEQQSTEKELELLEQYTQRLSGNDGSGGVVVSPETMKDALKLHKTTRKTLWDAQNATAKQLNQIDKNIEASWRVLRKERSAFARSHKTVRLEKEKKKAEKEQRKAEKAESKTPKLSDVYRVRITVEIPEADMASPEGVEASLTLTYTTNSASWTPHYDLRFDTTNPALSTLTYRALFTNQTYESWIQVPITLSTSQASFGGLGQKVPRLEKWRVTLNKKWNVREGENGTYSLAEIKVKEEEKQKELERVGGNGNWNNSELRRGEGNMKVFSNTLVTKKRQETEKGETLDGLMSRTAYLSAPIALTKSSAPRMMITASAPAMSASLPFGRGGGLRYRRADDSSPGGGGESADEDEDVAFDEGATLAPTGQLMSSTIAAADTYGFTTTYEFPTPRTVPSSALVRRHVIAEIPLPTLAFTYILLPKLQAAAFLKAKLRNTSNVPLLAGQAGLTLDGSFLGTLSFPRCAPDELVELALGVDQAVKVEYDRPNVKHATQGMIIMGKEEVGLYKRSMRITNSKSGPVSLVVLDQIPVSEDEKLKVFIVSPKGLKKEGDIVKNVGVNGKPTSGKQVTASPATVSNNQPPPSAYTPSEKSDAFSLKGKFGTMSKRESSSKVNIVPSATAASQTQVVANTPNSNDPAAGNAVWGKAIAAMKDNGEIRWDVDVLKGGCVSLVLEWECRVPSGDGVQALS